METAKELEIAVTITPGANSGSVADLTLGLMLTAARNIPAMDRAIRNGSWYRHTGVELGGKVLGIVGMGHIGGEVAKRAHAFGMKILAYNDVYMKGIAEELGRIEAIIACNGASIRRSYTDEIIYSQFLEKNSVLEIAQHCFTGKFDFTASVYGAMYCVEYNQRANIFHEYNQKCLKSIGFRLK